MEQPKIELNIHEVVFELKHLVNSAPLSKTEREKYQTYIQAISFVAKEWENLKNHGRPGEDK